MGHVARLTVATGCLLGLAGCEGTAKTPDPAMAVAQMSPTDGHRATGAATFTEIDGAVRVVAAVTGVPAGAHGFHIHEFGDCSSSDGTSAGGHWNPDDVAHGGRHAPVRHVGDLGNLTADADGIVTADFADTVIVFGGLRSIVGKAVILHADEDDLVSQPSGAAGARISCGVIEPVVRPGVD